MSKANRKRMYDQLVENDRLGLKPGLAQDDGALVKEFGEPKKEEPKAEPVKPKPKEVSKKKVSK